VSRRLKHDIPGPDWRVAPQRIAELGWAAAFAPDLERCLPVAVEIGFGRGEFLMALAAARPGDAFVGVERSPRRVLKMARRLARSELRNVRLLQASAEGVVDELLAPASVSEFWVNFPDPWPKKRHARRRFFQPAVVARLAERLVPGGVLHAATDDVPYAEQIHEILAKEARLENLHAPRAFLPERAGPIATAYEMQWQREGRPLHFFAYRRRP
jgi:tRNA (guanine-N7-)-methyltransferase